MDKTKTFIKQCEKAEEIQRRHFDFMGALRTYGINSHLTNSPHTFGSQGNTYYNDTKKTVWLPTQDRLQEMLEERYARAIENQNYWMSFTSREQLWLAFVMKEKYGKIWNGEDWVKESG